MSGAQLLGTGLDLNKTVGDLEEHAAKGEVANIVNDIYGFGSGVAKTVKDPFEALITHGLDWLMSVFTPLKDLMNLVTGDAEGLKSRSEEWAKVAEGLRSLGPQVTDSYSSLGGSWRGDASQACSADLTKFSQATLDMAGQVDDVVHLLTVSGELMDAAQEIIKSIIAQCIEYAIITMAAATAAAVVSLGASEAAGAAAVETEVAVNTARGAQECEKASSILTRIANVLKKLGGEFEKLATELEQSAQKLQSAARAGQEALRTGENLARAGRTESSGLSAVARDLTEAVTKRHAEFGSEITDKAAEAVTDHAKEAGRAIGADALDSAAPESEDRHEGTAEIDRDLVHP